MPTGEYVPQYILDAMIADYQTGATQTEAAGKFGYGHYVCGKAMARRSIPAREQTDAQRIYGLNTFFFQTIDTEAKAYWLGFITADGCVQSVGHNLDINLARLDRAHLEKMNWELDSELPILDYEVLPDDSAPRKMSRASFHSKQIVADLARHGITSRKSFTSEPWKGPCDLMAAYWRGAFDGDGAIYKSGGKWYIEFVGSRAMVQGFADFVSGNVNSHKTARPADSIFRVSYGGIDLPRQIATVLYGRSNVFLDRKKLLANELKDAVATRLYKSPPPRYDWLDEQSLIHLYERCGRLWRNVQTHLGCSRKIIVKLRKKFGMYKDERGLHRWPSQQD